MGAGTWIPEQFRDLGADAADAADQVEDLRYDVLLETPLAPDLADQERQARAVFGGAPDVTVQRFRCRGGLEGLAVFDQQQIDLQLLVLGVLRPLAGARLSPADGADPRLLQRVSRTIAPTGTSTTGAQGGADRLGSLADQLLSGAVVLCFDGCRRALAVKIGKADKRPISKPTAEPSVLGPHDGFIEDASTNLGLLRRRLRTPRLQVERFRLGTHTRTAVYLLSLRGVTDDRLVAEARRRLQGVRVDGILDSNVLAELIRDAPRAPVPTIQRSERPDRVASALLEGQIAIITDGTPFALMAPVTFGHMMKASDDYYEHWIPASVTRVIRLVALAVGVLLPAFYVAIVTFHPEFVPPMLLVTVAASRENVPLPTLGEVVLLLGLFEIIREAGVRIPAGIGSALTIGGTLVVGEAAVRAGIISAPVIIIASAVIIAFLAIPDYDMVQFSRFLLYPMLFAAGFLGIFGMLLAAFAFAFHLAALRSFGVSFLAPAAPLRPGDWHDSVLRAPVWAMDRRPAATGRANPVRQARHQKPRPPRVRP